MFYTVYNTSTPFLFNQHTQTLTLAVEEKVSYSCNFGTKNYGFQSKFFLMKFCEILIQP